MRIDRGTEALTFSHLSNHLLQLKINIIDNRNIIGKHLSHRGLHLSVSGCNQLGKNFLAKIKKFWEGKGCSGTADKNRHQHPSVFYMTSAPSSKNCDHQESGDFNFKECLKNIRQNNLNPANISTSDQRFSTLWINVEITLIRRWEWKKIQHRIFNVAQRWYNLSGWHWNNVETTLHNVGTTLIQRCLNLSSTLVKAILNLIGLVMNMDLQIDE